MKTDIFDEQMFVDPSTLSSVDTSTTKQLSVLVSQVNKVSEEISSTEENLKRLKAEKQRLVVEVIPQLMDEGSMIELKVKDPITGEPVAKIGLRPFVSASIPKDEEGREKAFGWLRDNDLGHIIKNDLTLSFGLGEDNVAGSVKADLENKGFVPEQKTNVNPQTLKKELRLHVEAGKDIQSIPFNAYVARTAVITSI
jgi:hypothetical protein